MCIRPLTIKNTWYGKPVHGNQATIAKYFHGDTSHIVIPCGTCPECLYRKQQQIVQRCVMMQQTHDIFFLSASYNNESLRTVEINGYKHQYADVRDVQLFIKRLKKHNVFGTKFHFMATNEYGGEKHRPHWHILFFLPKVDCSDIKHNPYAIQMRMNSIADGYFPYLLKEWSRNVGTIRNPIYKPLCTYVRKWTRQGLKTNFEFHWVDPYRSQDENPDNVAFYVSKYSIKPDKWLERKQQALRLNLSGEDYIKYWNLLKPRVLMSKFFGITDESKEYITDCIEKSIGEDKYFSSFVNPYSGHKEPLCLYYKKKYMTLGQSLQLKANAIEDEINFNPVTRMDDTRTDRDIVLAKYEKRRQKIMEKSDDYSE